MKKNMLTLSGLPAIVLCGMLLSTSCGSGDSGKEDLNISKEVKTPVKESKSMKFAYVEMDTIVSQYEYQKEVEAIMKAKESSMQSAIKSKESSAQSTLKTKGQAFQTRMTKFQNDLKNNKITSQEQYEREQAALAKLQEELTTLESKLTSEYQAYAAKLTEEYQELALQHTQAINDTIQHFLKLYGDEKGYDFLFGKSTSS